MQLWKYISLVCVLFLFGCKPDNRLTPEEQNYVNTHVVTWSADDNYYPFIFVDESNTPHGLTVDVMDLITKNTGLKFKMVEHGQLLSNLEDLKYRKIDMITSVRPTPRRSAYAAFTRPYLVVDLVLIKRVNVPKTTAVGKGRAVGDYLRAARKDLEITEYADDELSFRALLSGSVESAVMDVTSASYLVKKYGIDFDKSSIPFEYPLSFATSKKDAILRSILDKAITDITDREHEGIRSKWM